MHTPYFFLHLLLLILLTTSCTTRPVSPQKTGKSKIPESPVKRTLPKAQEVPSLPATYTWDEIAKRASTKAGKADLYRIKAASRRLKTALDTAWKNPQLRLGYSLDELSSDTPSHSGWRADGGGYSPYTTRGKWSDQDASSGSVGLRLYFTNPFVTRWMKSQGEAEARGFDARVQEASYAVYSEVKMLCLEADILKQELAFLKEELSLKDQVDQLRKRQAASNVQRSPLNALDAELKHETKRMEIRGKKMAYRQLIREIALLADLPPDQLDLVPEQFSPPRPETQNTRFLTDLAFLRRPDLQIAESERNAALYSVNKAKAQNIPWFDFAEAGYKGQESTTYGYENDSTTRDRTTRDRDEWDIRLAISLPISSWTGRALKLSRAELAAAETRLQGVYARIRQEVAGVLEDYQESEKEYLRLSRQSDALCQRVEKELNQLEKEGSVMNDEILKSRKELLAYRKIMLKVKREWLRQRLLLESVTGGPLPTGNR